jgi:hypothetical protein
MSAKHWLSVAVVCAAAFGVTTTAEAAKKREKPVVSGCTHFLQPFCIGITKGKTTYVLFGAEPRIPSGVYATVWGTTGGVSPCFNTAVQVTKWTRNPKRLCPQKS